MHRPGERHRPACFIVQTTRYRTQTELLQSEIIAFYSSSALFSRHSCHTDNNRGFRLEGRGGSKYVLIAVKRSVPPKKYAFRLTDKAAWIPLVSGKPHPSSSPFPRGGRLTVATSADRIYGFPLR